MTSLVSPDVSRQQCRVLPARSSCSSIDLNSLLGSSSLGNLLSYPLLLPSCTTESLSLYDVPPFPTYAAPPLYLNAFEDLPRRRPADPKWTSDAVITIPTSPRLRCTMMEAICIDWWRSSVSGSSPPVDTIPDEPGILFDIAWKPEGSVVPPGRFKRVRDDYALCNITSLSNVSLDTQDETTGLAYGSAVKDTGLLTEPGRLVIEVQVQDEGWQDFGAEGKHGVPTIMVSNSTAIVPLSLESSQSLASAPLAIRRGQNMLPPIAVPPSARPATLASSYPEIPSPFLGSPSSSSPFFEHSGDETRKPPEDLEYICGDLYDRLPVVCLPLSPTLETPEPAGVAHEQAPVLDAEDDWAGPQDFVNLHAATIPQLFQSTPPKFSLPTSPDSSPWGMTPTLVDTTQDSTPPHAHPQETTGIDTKKQRRRTVIIETSPTPQRTSLSPLAAQEVDEHTADQDPIPFETPAGHLVSCTACHNSMLASSRPLSTASMRPVRGILKGKKGKKSVRFSMVPECVVVDDDDALKEAARPRSGSVPPAAKSRGLPARRMSVAPAPPPPSPISPTKENEQTGWPRHPALRVMARHTADLSSPKPQAPITAKVAEERRSPLRSINLRQSLPVKRGSTAVHKDKGARKSVAVGDIGQPRRLMKTASTPVPVRTSVAKVNIENVAVKGEIVKPKSRMPVPLRSIFTFPRLRP